MAKQGEVKAKDPIPEAKAKPAPKQGKLIAVRLLGLPRPNDTLVVGGHLHLDYMPGTPERQIAWMERSPAGVRIAYGKIDDATETVPDAAIEAVVDLKLPALAYHYEPPEGGGA